MLKWQEVQHQLWNLLVRSIQMTKKKKTVAVQRFCNINSNAGWTENYTYYVRSGYTNEKRNINLVKVDYNHVLGEIWIHNPWELETMAKQP